MSLQTILYLLSLLITCALSAFLAVYAWRHKQVPGSSAYARLAASETLFALAEILSVLSPSTASALFWFQVRYLFGALAGVSWFLFALEYNGQQAWLSKRLLASLFIIPLITQILLWSNDLHGLWMQSEASFIQNGPFWIADLTTRVPSLGYLTHIFYALLLTITGIVLLLLTAWKMRREFIVQSLMLAGAGLTAFFFSANSLFNLLPELEFNPFTPGLGLSILLIALAVFRFSLLKRAPEKMAGRRLANLEEPEMRSLASLLLVFLVLASGIFASAYFSYTNYERQFRIQVEQQLSSVAELKIAELQNWRNERLGDAEALRSNPALAALVQTYLANPQDAQSAELLQDWLDGLQSAYQYERVFLLDLEGVERMASLRTSEPVAAHLIKDFAAVLASGQSALIDFHRNSAEGKIHLAVLVPIFTRDAANHPLGVLVLRIDPEQTLYPRIQQWPTPSESAETLLIRRDGDAVLFLNPLRFKDDAALKLRFSLTETDVLAVKAVLGQTGIIEGLDYRGVAVLGVLAPVPGTPWFLVARMDMAEVYAPLRERLWEMSVFFGGLLVACAAGLLLFWRQQRMRYYQAQIETLNALHDSQAQVANVFKSAMDAIITVDEDQKIIIFNPSAEQMFGCPADEVIGQTMDRFLPEYAHEIHRKHMHFFGRSDSTKRSMKTPMLALTCLRANGEAFASDISISHIEIGGRKLYTAIIRDITERNQAEDALQKSQAKLQAIMDYSPALISIKDLDGNIILANRSFSVLDAPPLNELIGKNVFEIFPKEVAERLWKNDLAALQAKAPIRSEEVVKYKDGTWHTYWTVKFPIYLQSDQPFGICAISNDITDRKQAEDKLRETNDYLENLFNYANAPIIVWDTQFKITRFNHAFETITGRSTAEVLGRPLKILFPPAQITASMELIRKTLSGERWNVVEIGIQHLDGSIRTVLWNSATLFAADGKTPVATIAQGQDITERKQIEDELRQSQENFARAFVSSPTALAITRLADGKFLSLNDAYTRVMGYEPAEILGHTPAEMKIYVNQGERDALIQQLHEKGTVRDYDLLVNTKSGEMRNLLVSMEPILYNKEASIISTFIDITERKLAEQKLANYSTHLEETVGQRTSELRDAQEQLVRQERLAALGQLAGSLGHELRNPLGVISNAVYFLKVSQPEASPKVKEYLDIIEKETRVSDKIVTDLLDFTRIKSLDRQPASVSELIDQTLERNPAPQSVEVQVEIPAGLRPVFADPQHVVQILSNLVSNAYQAMLAAKPASTEKKLKVSVEEQRDMMKIRVADTGPGIPPENLAKLFQPLFTTKTKGIGLGLAVSQKLVEANGGKIEVESAVGKGSAFTIYLPIYEKST